nr:aminoglycoside phosphotransferase family protein [Natronobeatus ordinarius]
MLKVDDHPRGHAADEGRVHEYVATHTSAPVPDVLAVGADHYLTAWDDALATTPATTDSRWARVAGDWLATLHADTAGEFGGFGRPRDDGDALAVDAHDEWIDAARERIASHREFLERVGHADVADAVDRFLECHPGVLDGAGEPVLCHGDVHPEHLAGSDGGRASAIDFEHALVAPAEYDYWRTAMPYLEAPDDVDDTVSRAFRDGYEAVRPLPDGLGRRKPIYRVVNLVAFLESLYLQRPVGPAERERRGAVMRKLVLETLEELRAAVG